MSWETNAMSERSKYTKVKIWKSIFTFKKIQIRQWLLGIDLFQRVCLNQMFWDIFCVVVLSCCRVVVLLCCLCGSVTVDSPGPAPCPPEPEPRCSLWTASLWLRAAGESWWSPPESPTWNTPGSSLNLGRVCIDPSHCVNSHCTI